MGYVAVSPYATGHVASSAFGPQDIATPGGAFSSLNASVAGLQNQLNGLQKEERRGLAAVAGTPPILTPSAPGKFTAAYRFDAPIPVYASASYANGGGGQNVFRVTGGVEF